MEIRRSSRENWGVRSERRSQEEFHIALAAAIGFDELLLLALVHRRSLSVEAEGGKTLEVEGSLLFMLLLLRKAFVEELEEVWMKCCGEGASQTPLPPLLLGTPSQGIRRPMSKSERTNNSSVE